MIPQSQDRSALEQEQFLQILSREDALARFEAALFPRAVPSEARKLADALGAALAEDITAPLDVPPFDRSNVDGFAVRSADLAAKALLLEIGDLAGQAYRRMLRRDFAAVQLTESSPSWVDVDVL